MRAESPIVGTGLEQPVAEDSRVLLAAEADGTVQYVDGRKITIKYDRSSEDDWFLLLMVLILTT